MMMLELKMKPVARLSAILFAMTVAACSSTGLPEGIEPVSGFELDRYLGTWYEIARLDNRFERGLEAVSATYSVKDNGRVVVLNRGWKTADQQWTQAEGHARFVGAEDVAHLAVSFLGPFYASYVVFELDEGYQNAWVTGSDRSTLWYLARSPVVDSAALDSFRDRARVLGFDTDKLIYVDQTRIQ